ncbi:MAG: hypothetical protein ABJF10_19515 [Chthoniobacter sp.]|uniref:hypothetical protein n=1 Tax=Chthoniobacter sp. TaxID=2510640 RepID=UPI0032ACADDC
MIFRRKELQRAVILETVLFLGGCLLVTLTFCLFCQLAGSLIWRLKLKYHYVEGRTRVEKAEVVHQEGLYNVRVTHRLENASEQHQTSEFTEEEAPSAPNAAEAELLRDRYQVGQLYPCWYLPGQPDYNNVLLREGLDVSWPLRRAWFPLLMGVPAWFACRWSWRRWKARGWAKDTPA